MWLLVSLALADSSLIRTVAVAPNESLRVTMAGAGEPVVLLPGLFGSAYGFRTLIPELTAAGYRAIVIEPLGIGASTRPQGADYSLTAQADRIAQAMDSLAVGPVFLVAHSVGASMAFRVAYRRPDLVRGVVSLDGGPVEAAATPAFRRAMRLAPWVKLFGGVKLVRRKIRGYLVEASGDPSWVTDEVVQGYTAGALADLAATLTAYLGMARAREPERLRDQLNRIRCPVQLLVGATPHAGGPTPADIALLRERLGVFAVDSVPGAGHFVQEERPAAVVAAIRRLSTDLPARHAGPAR